MELLLIELVLWTGLLFFIWGLKDGLNQVESDIERTGAGKGRKRNEVNTVIHARPEHQTELIGCYQDTEIYRIVVLSGKTYEFERIQPPAGKLVLALNEICLPPGLVYRQL